MAVFVSQDAEGTEVHVETTEGLLVDDVKDKGQTVLVSLITPPGHPTPFKYPVTGYISNTKPEDQAIIAVLEDAKANKTPLSNTRIEVARKAHVDKSLPIQEVRKGDATKDVIRRLVGVNGLYSSERLTSPSQDPQTGSGVPMPLDAPPVTNAPPAPSAGSVGVNKGTALNTLRNLATNKEVSDGVIDALKAQALLAGANYNEITEALTLDGDQNSAPAQVQSYFAKEAPSWKERNPDGRLNLGAGSVATGVGAYGFVYNTLHKNYGETATSLEIVSFYTELLLAIADTIQVGAYGKGFPVDRAASSHVRIRSVLFSLIETVAMFPLTGEKGSYALPEYDEANAWMQKVGKAGRAQFLAGVGISQQKLSVTDVMNRLRPEEEAPVTPAEPESEVSPQIEPGATEEPPVKATATPVVEQPAPESDYVESSNQEEGEENTPMALMTSSAPQTAPEPVATVAPETTPAQPDVSADALTVPLPEPTPLPPGYVNSDNQPTEETMEQFKDYIINEVGYKTKDDQIKVTSLLGYKFGRNYSKISNIPEDELGEMLDFYTATGPETFRQHVEAVISKTA